MWLKTFLFMVDFLDQIQIKSEAKQRLLILTNKVELPKIRYKSDKIARKYLKDYSLNDKIILAKSRIKEFLEKLPNQDIVISFSGGKDSCVLKDLVYKVQDDMGLPHSKLLIAAEIFHPETIKFIHSLSKNSYQILQPIKTFNKIIYEHGFPIISKQIAQKIYHIRNTKNHGKYIRAIFGLNGNKFGILPLKYIHFLDKKFVDYEISHKCCDYIKGNVKHDKRPVFIGTTIDESRLRRNSWLKYGCIHYTNKDKPDICKPLSLFNDKDIWQYIKENNVKVSKIYDLGYLRSGCVCCGFGLSLEEQLKKQKLIKNNRFELLYQTNQKLFFYFFNTLGMWKPLADVGINLNIANKQLIKFNYRKKEVKKWYHNIKTNLKNILNEIESRNPNVWTKKEKKMIYLRYCKGV